MNGHVSPVSDRPCVQARTHFLDARAQMHGVCAHAHTHMHAPDRCPTSMACVTVGLEGVCSAPIATAACVAPCAPQHLYDPLGESRSAAVPHPGSLSPMYGQPEAPCSCIRCPWQYACMTLTSSFCRRHPAGNCGHHWQLLSGRHVPCTLGQLFVVHLHQPVREEPLRVPPHHVPLPTCHGNSCFLAAPCLFVPSDDGSRLNVTLSLHAVDLAVGDSLVISSDFNQQTILATVNGTGRMQTQGAVPAACTQKMSACLPASDFRSFAACHRLP